MYKTQPQCARAQEYEKRLLKKEHEVKEARAEVQELRARLDSTEAALADTSRMLPAPEPSPGRRPSDFSCACHCGFHTTLTWVQGS